MKRILLIALLNLTGTQLMAADGLLGGKKTEYDRRVETSLNEADLKYDIDKDGDFKLLLNYDDNRTQLVFVQSKTEQYKNYEIREIFAYGYKSPTSEFSASIANRLLIDNSKKKMGAWEKRGEYAVYVIKISADADALSLKNAIQLAAVCAEEMEKEITPTKDTF